MKGSMLLMGLLACLWSVANGQETMEFDASRKAVPREAPADVKRVAEAAEKAYDAARPGARFTVKDTEGNEQRFTKPRPVRPTPTSSASCKWYVHSNLNNGVLHWHQNHLCLRIVGYPVPRRYCGSSYSCQNANTFPLAPQQCSPTNCYNHLTWSYCFFPTNLGWRQISHKVITSCACKRACSSGGIRI